MTHSADSPILGTGTASAEAINAWFARTRQDRSAGVRAGQDLPACAVRYRAGHHCDLC